MAFVNPSFRHSAEIAHAIASLSSINVTDVDFLCEGATDSLALSSVNFLVLSSSPGLYPTF